MRKEYPHDSDEFQFFKDYWSYFQAFGMPEEKIEYWQGLLSAQSKLREKYENSDISILVKEILLATNKHFERVAQKNAKHE